MVARTWPSATERMTILLCARVVESAITSLSRDATRSPAGLIARPPYSWRLAAPAGTESNAQKAEARVKRMRRPPDAETDCYGRLSAGPRLQSIGAGDGEFRRFGQRGLGLRCREHGKRVDRAAAVVASAFDRVGESIGLVEQLNGVGEILVRDPIATDCRLPEFAIGLVAAGVGEDDRKGHFAVAKIVADAFAHGCRVRGEFDG